MNLFSLLKSSEVLQHHLQRGEMFHVFMAGLAPDGVQLPYVVWQTISRNPLNYLAGRPDVDEYLVQIDIYATQLNIAQHIAVEIERILEFEHRVRGQRVEQDAITKHYRVMLEVDMLILR